MVKYKERERGQRVVRSMRRNEKLIYYGRGNAIGMMLKKKQTVALLCMSASYL